MRSKVILLLLVLLITTASQALNIYLGVADGLSNRHVTCILQDHSGLIWIGTANGLNVYDGYSFKAYFTFTEGVALSNARINCLAEDKEGNIWVGTNSGLNRISPNRSSNLVVERLKDRGIVSLFLLPHQTLEIGTTLGEVLILNSSLQLKTLYKDGREVAINGLRVDNNGSTWFFTNSEKSIYAINPSGTHSEKFAELISSNFLINGRNIITSFQSQVGIKVIDGGKQIAENHFLDSLNKLYGQANLLLLDKRKTLWAAYPGGVLVHMDLEKKIVTNYSHNFKRAYFGSAITCMEEDQNGMIWVGTDGGLVKVSVASQSFRWHLDNPNNNDPQKFISIRGMYENKKGDLYIGTYNGLYQLNAKDNSLKQYLIGKTSKTVPYRIMPVDDRTLLMTTIFDGLQYFDQVTGRFSPAASIVDPLDRELYGLFEDSDGIVWVGTRKGLRQYDKKRNVLVKYVDDGHNEAIRSSYVYDINEFPKGILWVCTSKGLLKIDKISGKVKHYTVNSVPHLSNKEILSITPDNDNTLWIASHGGGLMKLDIRRDSMTYINTTDGLSSSIVYGVVPDGRYLWISTEDGISGMDVTTGKFKNYHEKDGLTDNEFNSAAYLKTSDGRIYFGGINGVNSFDPRDLVEEKTNDRIILVSLKRGNVELVNEITDQVNPKVTFPYDDRNLSIQFALTDYYRPRENRFQYQIKGLDNDWVNVGTQNFLRISQLPVGTYELVVKGKNPNDQESINQIRLTLQVEQVFYKKAQFILLAAVFFLGLVYFFFRMKIKQLYRMQRLRTKIASDLHDEVGSMLTRISILTEVLKYKNKDQEEIVQIAAASRQATSTMSDVLWSVDARNDKVGNLVDRMREHADSLLPPLNIAVQFDSSLDQNNPLDMQTRQNILLIFKEAIHNIAKHANASQVQIELKLQENTLIMVISDNGNGVSLKNGAGQGLKNMSMRAQEIGALIQTENGNGYTVTLRKKL